MFGGKLFQSSYLEGTVPSEHHSRPQNNQEQLVKVPKWPSGDVKSTERWEGANALMLWKSDASIREMWSHLCLPQKNPAAALWATYRRESEDFLCRMHRNNQTRMKQKAQIRTRGVNQSKGYDLFSVTFRL